MMKEQVKKLSDAEEKRRRRRKKLLGKRRLLLLYLRTKNRSAATIQMRVRERLEWKRNQRRDEAAIRIQRFRRSLLITRTFRNSVLKAGSVMQHIKNSCALVLQRSFRNYNWRATRNEAAWRIQRFWQWYITRMHTKRRYIEMIFSGRSIAASRIQRCLRGRWQRAKAKTDLHARILQAKIEHERALERQALKRKKDRVMQRIKRNEISRITYARKQHMLEFKARQGMAGWLHSRGLGLDLEPDNKEVTFYFDRIGEPVEPEGIDDWVHYFVQNEHCTREKAKIRGMEVLLRSMSKNMGQYKMKDVKQFFRKFDKNKDGEISTKEFRKVLEELDMNLTPAQINKCALYLDDNNSGKISYTEFQAALAIYQRKYYPKKTRRLTGGMSPEKLKQLRQFVLEKDGLVPGQPEQTNSALSSTLFL